MLLNKIQGDQNATEQDNQAYVQQQCEQNNKYICILANIYRRPRGFAGTFICRLAAIIFIVFCIRGLPAATHSHNAQQVKYKVKDDWDHMNTLEPLLSRKDNSWCVCVTSQDFLCMP
eukprot:scpid99394/ scgid6447/ 